VAKDFFSVLAGKPMVWFSDLITLKLRRSKMNFVHKSMRVLGRSGLSALKEPALRMSRELWHSVINERGLRMQWAVKGWKVELEVQGSEISINVKK
jgi:hypothetical protein